MCFHTYEEMIAWEKEHVDNKDKVGFVIMRDPKTKAFQEAYFCLITSVQSIANTVRNLRTWHPGHRFIDFAEVNEARRRRGLFRVGTSTLPPPTGVCPPSEDASASVESIGDAFTRALESA